MKPINIHAVTKIRIFIGLNDGFGNLDSISHVFVSFY